MQKPLLPRKDIRMLIGILRECEVCSTQSAQLLRLHDVYRDIEGILQTFKYPLTTIKHGK